MPFTRVITSCFLFGILLIAVFGPGDHPWFTNETLWLTVLFAVSVWLMSLQRDFFLDMVAILFAIFFLQRIVVIYFRPDQMSYQEHLKFSPLVFNEALLFSTAISIAVLLGYFFASYKDIQKHKRIVINFNSLFGIRYDFEFLFNIYSLFLCASLIFEVYLMFGLKVGVTALEFDRQFAPLLRIVQIIQVLHFLPILVLASEKFKASTRKKAFYLLILLLIRLIFFITSKAALLYLCLIYLTCQCLCGIKIPKKYIITSGILFLLTIFVLAPVVTVLRAGFIELVEGSMSFSDVFHRVIDKYTLIVSQLFFSFTNRMGVFDWLTGFMTVGRDPFLQMASFSNDLIEIINSLVPGDLVERLPDYVTISKLMPHILRGWALGSYPGHSENMGGAGLTYLYFSKAGGVLFFFVWSFISTKILKSRINIIIKILFFISFVINFFVGGYLVTSIKMFYEGLIMLIVMIVVSEITHPKLYARSRLLLD